MVLLAAGALAWAHPAAAQDSDEDTAGPSILRIDPADPAGSAVVDRDGDVKVIRGSAVQFTPVVQAFSSKAADNSEVDTVGADTLWFVDRKAAQVTGCVLAATIIAGDDFDVRCQSRRLP